MTSSEIPAGATAAPDAEIAADTDDANGQAHRDGRPESTERVTPTRASL